jgi:hypothetical protein
MGRNEGTMIYSEEGGGKKKGTGSMFELHAMRQLLWPA